MKFSILATALLSSAWSVVGAPVTEADTEALGVNANHEVSGANSQQYHYSCKNGLLYSLCEPVSHCDVNGIIVTRKPSSCGEERGCMCKRLNGLATPASPVDLTVSRSLIAPLEIPGRDDQSQQYHYQCIRSLTSSFCESVSHCDMNGVIVTPKPSNCGEKSGCMCKRLNGPATPAPPVGQPAPLEIQPEGPIQPYHVECKHDTDAQALCGTISHCTKNGTFITHKPELCGAKAGCMCKFKSPTTKQPPPVVVREDQTPQYHYNCKNLTTLLHCKLSSECAKNGTILTPDQDRCGLEAGCTCKLNEDRNPGYQCPPKPTYALTCENSLNEKRCQRWGAHCSTNGTLIGPESVCGKKAGCHCKQEVTPETQLCSHIPKPTQDNVEDQQVEAPVVTRDVDVTFEYRYGCPNDPILAKQCISLGAYCEPARGIWHTDYPDACGPAAGCTCLQGNWPDKLVDAPNSVVTRDEDLIIGPITVKTFVYRCPYQPVLEDHCLASGSYCDLHQPVMHFFQPECGEGSGCGCLEKPYKIII